MDKVTPPRGRTAYRGAAGPLEVISVVVFAIVVWRLVLGWDWTAVPTSTPGRDTTPQTSVEWTVFGIAAMLAVGWLALRGRAVVGTIAVCVPIILLSGWRMAVAGVIGWPAGLASLVFSLTAMCLMAAALGAWLRYRDAIRRR